MDEHKSNFKKPNGGSDWCSLCGCAYHLLSIREKLDFGLLVAYEMYWGLFGRFCDFD